MERNEEYVFPNEERPLQPGKIGLKRARVEVDVDADNDKKNLDEIHIDINNVSNELVKVTENQIIDKPDNFEFNNSTVDVDNIKYKTNGLVLRSSIYTNNINKYIGEILNGLYENINNNNYVYEIDPLENKEYMKKILVSNPYSYGTIDNHNNSDKVLFGNKLDIFQVYS